MEIWKPIAGCSGYEISNQGRVRSYLTMGRGSQISPTPQRITKLINRENRYMIATLRIKGKYKSFYIHRLVLEAFVGPCPDGLEACHNDGDNFNNHLSNLRWDTHISNCLDRTNHGVPPPPVMRGEDHPMAKLTGYQVLQIRELLCLGNTPKQLADSFKVTDGTIRHILNRRTWNHLEET